MIDNFVTSIKLEKPLPKNSYLNNIEAVNYLKENKLIFDCKVTILIGENGSGKSTLIEAIAIALGFNPEGGTKNYAFSSKDTHSNLAEYLTISKNRHVKRGFFLRAESFYNTLSYYDDIYEGEREPRHNMSHGESFLNVAKEEFKGNDLYILDEPEAALSPSRLMSLLCIIHEAELKNAQFIIATHSPILMSYPNACIYELSEEGINKIDYINSDHYRITKSFIDKPEVMYKHLFNE